MALGCVSVPPDMARDVILAIERGTTGTTVLAVDSKLQVIARCNREFRQIYPKPGWVEHVSEKLDGVPAKRRVELLQLTAQMYVDARKRKLVAAGGRADDIDIDTLFPPTVELKTGGRKPTTPRVVTKPTRTAN